MSQATFVSWKVDCLKYCPVTEGRVTLTKLPFPFQSGVIFTNTCEFPKYVDSYTGFMWSHPHLWHVGTYLQGKVSGKAIVCEQASSIPGRAGMEGQRARMNESRNSCFKLAVSSSWLFVSQENKAHSHLFVKVNCIDRSMNECWSLGCVRWSHWNLGSNRADLTWENFT